MLSAKAIKAESSAGRSIAGDLVVVFSRAVFALLIDMPEYIPSESAVRVVLEHP